MCQCCPLSHGIQLLPTDYVKVGAVISAQTGQQVSNQEKLMHATALDQSTWEVLNNIKHVEQTKSGGIHFQAHTACPLHSVAHISKLKLQTITNHLPNHQCRKTHAGLRRSQQEAARDHLLVFMVLALDFALGLAFAWSERMGSHQNHQCSNVLQVVRGCCDPLRTRPWSRVRCAIKVWNKIALTHTHTHKNYWRLDL